MQTLRQLAEEREKQTLSQSASFSCESRGRRKKEEECEIRTAYQHDRDRIIHSKAFRRLKHKTQVFISPTGDHYRTRLTHTLETSQVARTIARALNLNEDLTEAIALGHDLGHTPFGHAGENAIDQILKKFGKRFHHNVQSLHVINDIEKLNLTEEVRDGVLNHPWTFPDAKTLEGQIVRFADRIAYINHDIDDSIRSGILKKNEIPNKFLAFIGKSPVDAFVKDVVSASSDLQKIKMSKNGLSALNGLYKFMFNKVYMGEESKEENKKVEHVIKSLFSYYMGDPEKIPGYKKSSQKNKADIVRDFIGGMTDRYAIKTFEQLFVPTEWKR